ncbi:MAG: hypothetical protein K2Q24_03260 [Chitinophagaceae bacterium]|nr:hypothetical protein [Chitinophagaceae bacterium]
MKSFGIVMICILAGGGLGLLVGGGESTLTKKSVRETTFPLFSIIGCVAGALFGIVIASKINTEEKDNNQFGFDSFQTFEGKVGRKWFLQTKWVNPVTKNENTITTEYLNEFNSGVTDGSKAYIQKTHLAAVNTIKANISNGVLQLI